MNNFILDLYVDMYMHYPDCFSSNAISEKLNLYFEEYFSYKNKLNIEVNSYVMIKSAPHNQNESVDVKAKFSEMSECIETMIFDWRVYIADYFKVMIDDVKIDCVY